MGRLNFRTNKVTHMNVIIGGKRWKFLWWPFGRSINDGDCTFGTKTIRIRDGLNNHDRQDRLMEIAIHESTHARWPCLDELEVEEFAEELQAILFRLGYRRMRECENTQTSKI